MPAGSDRNVEDEIERLVTESMAAWEAGDFRKALRLGDRACQIAPEASVAHRCRAAALAELGRLEQAREACERAVELSPDDPDVLAYGADFYLTCMGDEPGSAERALELSRRGLRAAKEEDDEELEAECLLLRGYAEEELGRLPEALGSVEAALRVLEDDTEALIERGILLFELCRFGEARAQLEAVSKKGEDLAVTHHYLGLMDEREGNAEAAERHLQRARQLAPDLYHPPVRISAGEFDQVLEEALSRLPARVRDYLSNVAVMVEELPSDEDLRASPDQPLSPTVLGVFRGSPLGEQQLLDPWSHFPSSILLYQKNLERSAHDREELIDQIAITLLHEVGHFLGLDEHDLAQRGLD